MLMMERIRLNSLPAQAVRPGSLLLVMPMISRPEHGNSSTNIRFRSVWTTYNLIPVPWNNKGDEHSDIHIYSHVRKREFVCAFLPFYRSPFSNTFSVVRS